MKKMIKTWEHENEKLFMVYEDRYLDVIERQWATYQLEKDMHKAERVCEYRITGFFDYYYYSKLVISLLMLLPAL